MKQLLLVLLAACASPDDEPEPVVVQVSAGDEDPLPAPPPQTLTPDEAQTAFVQQEAPSGVNAALPNGSQIADPNASPRAAGLEPALAHYRALHALSFTQTQHGSIQVATQALMQVIQAGADEVQEVDRACDGVAAVAECTTLRADARDLLGERIRTMTMPLPQDLEAQIQTLATSMQNEIRTQVTERVREVVQARAAEAYCQAAALYRQAATQRAQDQLARYGSLTGCP